MAEILDFQSNKDKKQTSNDNNIGEPHTFEIIGTDDKVVATVKGYLGVTPLFAAISAGEGVLSFVIKHDAWKSIQNLDLIEPDKVASA